MDMRLLRSRDAHPFHFVQGTCDSCGVGMLIPFTSFKGHATPAESGRYCLKIYVNSHSSGVGESLSSKKIYADHDSGGVACPYAKLKSGDMLVIRHLLFRNILQPVQHRRFVPAHLVALITTRAKIIRESSVFINGVRNRVRRNFVHHSFKISRHNFFRRFHPALLKIKPSAFEDRFIHFIPEILQGQRYFIHKISSECRLHKYHRPARAGLSRN